MYDFSKFVRSYTILRWSLSNNNQYNFKGMKSFRLKIRDGWTHNVLPPSDQIAFQLYDNMCYLLDAKIEKFVAEIKNQLRWSVKIGEDLKRNR